MSIISFDEWKQKKARSSALTSRGALREDVALREAYGFDLCVYISEERSQLTPDSAQLDQLWEDLRKLMASLPQEHAYFYFRAFEAFTQEDLEQFGVQFDLYLESEKRIFQELADCDWWIDSLVWVFTPPLEGMYSKLSELFFKHWPDCAMGWVCLALEQGGLEGTNGEISLNLLHSALERDANCYLADYLIASIYYEQGLWKSALPYFERASKSQMYKEDAAFYFDYAWACEKAGDFQAAEGFYRSVMALDEGYPSASNNLGCIYLRLKRYDEALQCFQYAMELGKDGALPYRNMVSVLERQGRQQECIDFIKKHMGQLGPQYEALLELLENTEQLEAINEYFEALPAEDGSGLMRKRMVEDELEQRILQGEKIFGRRLEMVEDEGGYGRAYYIPEEGCIDLLTVNPGGKEYLLISVAPAEADERHMLLLYQKIYSFAARQQNDQYKTHGALVCSGLSPSLQSRLKHLDDLHIEIYQYNLELNRLKS